MKDGIYIGKVLSTSRRYMVVRFESIGEHALPLQSYIFEFTGRDGLASLVGKIIALPLKFYSFGSSRTPYIDWGSISKYERIP
jgi:hypothetical protein